MPDGEFLQGVSDLANGVHAVAGAFGVMPLKPRGYLTPDGSVFPMGSRRF